MFQTRVHRTKKPFLAKNPPYDRRNENLLSRLGSTVTFMPVKGGADEYFMEESILNCTHLVLHRDTNSPGETLPQYLLQDSRVFLHSAENESRMCYIIYQNANKMESTQVSRVQFVEYIELTLPV